MGGEAKQYQVVLDPKRLAGYHLSLGDVARASSSATTPSIGGGYIEKNRRVVRHPRRRAVPAASRTSRTPSSPSDADGTPVLIKNLGDGAASAPALRFGAVTKHGEGEIVAGTVMMLTGAELARGGARRSRQRLAEIQKELPDGRRDPLATTTAPSSSTACCKTVAINLAEGALLVVVVLFLTLGSLRGALIAALAIPLSMGDRAHRHGAPAASPAT